MPTATQPQAMTAAELECHIADLAGLMEQAYARFEAHGNPADRDEAYRWLRMRDQALRERLADDGFDFFQTAGARDALALRAGAPA